MHINQIKNADGDNDDRNDKTITSLRNFIVVGTK